VPRNSAQAIAEATRLFCTGTGPNYDVIVCGSEMQIYYSVGLLSGTDNKISRHFSCFRIALFIDC